MVAVSSVINVERQSMPKEVMSFGTVRRVGMTSAKYVVNLLSENLSISRSMTLERLASKFTNPESRTYSSTTVSDYTTDKVRKF